MSLEEHKEHTFDTFCKRIVKNEAVSIHREYQRQLQDEVAFSDLTIKEQQQLQHKDEYALERQVFLVLGEEVEILNGDLARALATLTPKRRAIIILAYYEDMADLDIARLFKLNRSTVQYQRTSSLERLRKIMEELENEEEAQ